MNKKLLILGIMMLLLTVLLSTTVLAAEINSAEITITPSKTECKAGEDIEFIVSLKNLEASDGILGLGAYIDYDSNLFTLNPNAKGLSGWTDADISTKTNRFATTKNSHSSNNEDILKITVTPKEVTGDVTTSIKLKKIEISNGTEYNINEVSSNNITIKPSSNTNNNNSDVPTVNPNQPSTGSNTPNTSNTTNDSNGSNSSSNSSNNSGNSSSTSKLDNNNLTNNNNNIGALNNTISNNGKSNSALPQTGFNNGYLLIIMALVIVIALFLFIKIRILNKD